MFPVDGPPIQDGFVAIANGSIVDLGRRSRADGDVEDLGDVALLPGLVNAHTHLEFSHLKRPLAEPGASFADWIRLAISERRRRSFRPAAAIAAGCRESLWSGVTTVGEIATAPASSYAYAAEAPQQTIFREVIGFSRARAASAFAAAYEETAALSEVIRDLPQAAVGISPHAPYTVSHMLLEQLVQLANERGMAVAMHLAESREELELLRTGSGPLRELLEERSMWDPEVIRPGSSPSNYLEQLARAPRALVIHGNYLAGDEVDYLAAHRDRLSLVHCPRTHAYFGHEPIDIASLSDRGVRIALGTDSRASNPDLSLWGDIRALASQANSPEPMQILRMATLSGAEALGRDDCVGSLSTGKLANLVAMPLPVGASGDASALLSAVMADTSRPMRVWLRGAPVELDPASAK